MKKHLNIIIIILVTLLVCVQPSLAVLTSTAPSKYKINTVKYNKTTVKPNTYSKPVKVITYEEKQRYYNNYLNYLEQVILETGNFTPHDTYNAQIAINLYFDDNYNLTKAYVVPYGNYESEKKCKICESKLFLVKFKPYDSRYAIDRSTKEFYIVLKNINKEQDYSKEHFISILKDYWTATSQTSKCLVKVSLTYNNDILQLKSYNIISSSGDQEYNSMVNAAFKRTYNSYDLLNHKYDFHFNTLTYYVLFEGDDITEVNDPNDVSNSIIQDDNFIMNMRNSIIP